MSESASQASSSSAQPPASATSPSGCDSLSSRSQPSGSPTTSPAPSLPSLLTINRLKVPTLQHIPKAARSCWAFLVKDVLQEILSDPSGLVGWTKWFMLPRCILASPARGGRSHWGDALKSVRSRIKRWRSGDFLGLWDEALGGHARLDRKGRL